MPLPDLCCCIDNYKQKVDMKQIALFLLMVLMPSSAFSQAEQYYMYNIAVLQGNIGTEWIKVKVDDGKTVKYVKDSTGVAVKFNTPAAVLMHFISEGWSLYDTGHQETGSASTVIYWILRRPCTKEEFMEAARNSMKKRKWQ